MKILDRSPQRAAKLCRHSQTQHYSVILNITLSKWKFAIFALRFCFEILLSFLELSPWYFTWLRLDEHDSHAHKQWTQFQGVGVRLDNQSRGCGRECQAIKFLRTMPTTMTWWGKTNVLFLRAHSSFIESTNLLKLNKPDYCNILHRFVFSLLAHLRYHMGSAPLRHQFRCHGLAD